MSDNKPPVQPPPVMPPHGYQPPPPEEPNLLGIIIPTSNPSALTGYYIGLFSILPLFGLLMGPAGIWLGLRGLRAVRETPGLPGRGHAITAIVGGIFGCLVNYGIGGIIAYALLTRPGR